MINSHIQMPKVLLKRFHNDNKESQNAELLALINYVNASPNKVLILNSRITILQEAKERKPELLKCFEGKQCKVYILGMAAIDIVEKEPCGGCRSRSCLHFGREIHQAPLQCVEPDLYLLDFA